MKFRSILCHAAGVVLLGLCGLVGCGEPAADTGPTEEPNIGPGVPAGGPVPAAKGAVKADSTGPASTKDAAKKSTKDAAKK